MTSSPRPVSSRSPAASVDRTGSEQRHPALPLISERIWWALICLLALGVAYRVGAFHLWDTVAGPDGRRVRLPDTFAAVDHPFHVARAEALRRALADGHPLRWIGHHQGGYPAEFYPLGVAWVEVGVWALLLGTLPIAAVHKLVVVLLFLLPGLGYTLMARRDRRPVGVGLAALAAHVAVPGAWWQGGYMELIDWGLVTNVAAAIALLFVLFWLTMYLEEGQPVAAVGAALTAAFAVSTNPRSLIALAVIGAGAWLALAFRPRDDGPSPAALTRRLALVVGVTTALAAPQLVALLRFEELYYFVRYQRYDAPADYLRASLQAVSSPVLPFAVVGLAVGLVCPGRTISRAAAVTLALYTAATAVLSFGTQGAALLQQLETPRLMPFQRLLTVYLAAVAVHHVADWLTTTAGRRGATVADLALLGVAAIMMVAPPVAPAMPAGEVPLPDRSLYPVLTAALPAQADFGLAVRAADEAASPGTAVLVLGSQISWHQALSAPLHAERPFFYDDWLWYWQTRHYGDYDPRAAHAYRDDASTLRPDYLARHAIGAVVVTKEAKRDAAASSALTPVRTGVYDVYAVRAPTTIVTLAGANAGSSDVASQRLAASGTSAGGEALIRRNWYPRWRATVNGDRAAITQTADGYMSVPVPAGEARIELRYAVDTIDWLARVASGIGFAAAIWLASGRVWRRTREVAGSRRRRGTPRGVAATIRASGTGPAEHGRSPGEAEDRPVQ